VYLFVIWKLLFWWWDVVVVSNQKEKEEERKKEKKGRELMRGVDRREIAVFPGSPEFSSSCPLNL